MIVDCPNLSYIDDLTSSELLNVKNQLPEARLSFILHKVGQGVLEDPRYLRWMNSYDPEVQVCAHSRPFTLVADSEL
jgi:hypothetical protein